MRNLSVILLTLLLFGAAATCAVGQDSDQEERVHAIQDRIYQKSHELGIAAGYIPDDDFFEAFPVGGYYMFTFNEHISWEVVRAQWIFTNEKRFKVGSGR